MTKRYSTNGDFRKLSALQERFVKEYVRIKPDGKRPTPTEAAQAAGYTERNAVVSARRNLAAPHVIAAIERELKELRTHLQIPPDAIMEEWRSIAFSDIKELFRWDEKRLAFVPSENLTRRQTAAIKSIRAKTIHFHPQPNNSSQPRTEIQFEIQLHDKLKALDRIAEMMGMLDNRVHVDGQIEVRHTATVTEMDDAELLERASTLVQKLRSGGEVRKLREG